MNVRPAVSSLGVPIILAVRYAVVFVSIWPIKMRKLWFNVHYIISPTLSDCIQTLKKHMINKGNKVFRHNFRKKKFIN